MILNTEDMIHYYALIISSAFPSFKNPWKAANMFSLLTEYTINYQDRNGDYKQYFQSISIHNKEITQQLKISERRFFQLLIQLCEANVLHKVRNGTYIVNPYIIGTDVCPSEFISAKDELIIGNKKCIEKTTVKYKKDNGLIVTRKITNDYIKNILAATETCNGEKRKILW